MYRYRFIFSGGTTPTVKLLYDKQDNKWRYGVRTEMGGRLVVDVSTGKIATVMMVKEYKEHQEEYRLDWCLEG